MSFYSWSEIRTEKVTDKLSRKVISGNNVMVAQMFLKKGCVVASHKHESEQITQIISGCLKIFLPEREVTLHEGDVLHIPSTVEHSAVALEETLALEAFSPIREDWLKGTDDYLRK